MSSTFWSDSQIVIAYIRSGSRRFKPFIANRVATIRQSSNPDQWKFISPVDNPAVALSRGCDSRTVPQSWFLGPSFLWNYKSTWPVDSLTDEEILESDPEVRKPVTTFAASGNHHQHPIEAVIQHYSSFYKIKKALSWLLRLKKQLRQ